MPNAHMSFGNLNAPKERPISASNVPVNAQCAYEHSKSECSGGTPNVHLSTECSGGMTNALLSIENLNAPVE